MMNPQEVKIATKFRVKLSLRHPTCNFMVSLDENFTQSTLSHSPDSTSVNLFFTCSLVITKRLLTTFEFNVGVGVNVCLALSLDWYPQGNDGGDNYSSGSHLGALRVIQQVEFTSSRFLSANGRVFSENEREKCC